MKLFSYNHRVIAITHYLPNQAKQAERFVPIEPTLAFQDELLGNFAYPYSNMLKSKFQRVNK